MDRYIAITGGVGGAKLCLGLARALDPEQLDFVVNTGDDFEHLGLSISPDIDTLTYTLAGLVNTETGWGRANETWSFMAAVRALGGETWFNLGDADLAMHVERTRRLAAGERLTTITRGFATSLGVRGRILPMSDDPVRTRVVTAEGELAFQHYFVRDRCAPAVTAFRFDGADAARITIEVAAAFEHPALAGVILCPSNPFVSIGPMLAIRELRERIAATRVPVVAISPIVAGLAIKGPTAKMMAELGVPSSAVAVARHYRDACGDLLDGFVLDGADAALEGEIEALGLAALSTPTVMLTLADRIALARRTVDFIHQLR
jgi:LPPG:FO 2-phospho-L-lactate transferase